MIVAIHQPDLLPYSGFWFKMLQADVFVVARHDQFQKHGYQRRVTMRGTWCSHQLVGKPSMVPIEDVEVASGWQQRLVDVIRGRHADAPHWKERGPDLLRRVEACEGTDLAEVNLSLMHAVRDLLAITTPIAFTDPPVGNGFDRLVEQVRAVGGDAYLSGSGATAYLGDDAGEKFAAEGIELRWTDHEAPSPDSIATVLLDFDDPAAAIAQQRQV